MFGRKNRSRINNHIDTLVGANTCVTGDITFTGGLRIDGHVTGNIVALDNEQSTLVLSSEGSIKGRIKVANLIINGTVTGPIYAHGYVELQTRAKVYGDIRYGSLEIQLGAAVEGKMIHYQSKSESEYVQQPAERTIALISSAESKQSASKE